jgi:hypothetical protein
MATQAAEKLRERGWRITCSAALYFIHLPYTATNECSTSVYIVRRLVLRFTNEAIYIFHNPNRKQVKLSLKTITHDLTIKYAIRQTVYVVFIKTRLVFRYNFMFAA